ncbi:MAG TPA: TatD family hydrolase [Methanoregulaceae archaeon]|nr:TatD family hydrolase [Methanoregulaceae archaeon]
MKISNYPVTDDHIHIDPVNGRGLAAAKDFRNAGGTHIFLVSKPSGSFGILPRDGNDFSEVFRETLRVADLVRELGLTVFPVLGVHPAEISRLTSYLTLGETVAIMKRGLEIASGFIEEGTAVALKSGRPHYEVPEELWNASNEILRFALALASDLGCAIQLHAESGPCEDVVQMASDEGLPIQRVVKHYASPDTPLMPSMIATNPDIPAMAKDKRIFTMESDYMDENSRPGAVIGPKSVPRITRKLFTEGTIGIDDVWRIHCESPASIYGVELSL